MSKSGKGERAEGDLPFQSNQDRRVRMSARLQAQRTAAAAAAAATAERNATIVVPVAASLRPVPRHQPSRFTAGEDNDEEGEEDEEEAYEDEDDRRDKRQINLSSRGEPRKRIRQRVSSNAPTVAPSIASTSLRHPNAPLIHRSPGGSGRHAAHRQSVEALDRDIALAADRAALSLALADDLDRAHVADSLLPVPLYNPTVAPPLLPVLTDADNAGALSASVDQGVQLRCFSSLEEAQLPVAPSANSFWLFVFLPDSDTTTIDYNNVYNHPLVQYALGDLLPKVRKNRFPLDAMRVFRQSVSRVGGTRYELWKGGQFIFAHGEDEWKAAGVRGEMMPLHPEYHDNYAYCTDVAGMRSYLESEYVKEGEHAFLIEIFFSMYTPLLECTAAISKSLRENNATAVVVFVDLATESAKDGILKDETWAMMLPAVKIFSWDSKHNHYVLIERCYAEDHVRVEHALADHNATSDSVHTFVMRRHGEKSLTARTPYLKRMNMPRTLSLVHELFTIDANKLLFNQTPADKIGSGSNGAVYKGKWYTLPVAIKVMNKAHSDDATADMFEEAHRLSQLRHPNITQILGLTIKNKSLCLVQELCSYNLRSWMFNRQPLITVLVALRDVIRALAMMHGQGVIHHDVKPENVLYTEGVNTTKVGDVGHSRLADISAAPLAVRAATAGTPMWFAPEMMAVAYKPHQDDVTHKSIRALRNGDFVSSTAIDIFAFGLLAYAFITGTPLDTPLLHKKDDELMTWCTVLSIHDGLIEYMKGLYGAHGTQRDGMILSIYASLIMRDLHLVTVTIVDKPFLKPQDRPFIGRTIHLFPLPADPTLVEVCRNIALPCLNFLPHRRPKAEDIAVALELHVDALYRIMSKHQANKSSSSSSSSAAAR